MNDKAETTRVSIRFKVDSLGNETKEYDVAYADFFQSWFIMTFPNGGRTGIPAERIAWVEVGPGRKQ